jgi:hypothetical protein
MAKALYGVDDLVFLKEGRGSIRASGKFRIIAVLPEMQGQAQYKVRSDAEGFERRIMASEIDVEKSPVSSQGNPATGRTSGDKEPWFKPSSIKITR